MKMRKWIFVAFSAVPGLLAAGLVAAMGGGMMGGGMMGGAQPWTPDEQGARALASPDGRLFAAQCASCHALPSPARHSAQEWPAVVARMKTHMRELGRPQPSAAQERRIVSFLQRNSEEAVH